MLLKKISRYFKENFAFNLSLMNTLKTCRLLKTRFEWIRNTMNKDLQNITLVEIYANINAKDNLRQILMLLKIYSKQTSNNYHATVANVKCINVRNHAI